MAWRMESQANFLTQWIERRPAHRRHPWQVARSHWNIVETEKQHGYGYNMVESDPGQGFGLGGVVTSVIRKPKPATEAQWQTKSGQPEPNWIFSIRRFQFSCDAPQSQKMECGLMSVFKSVNGGIPWCMPARLHANASGNGLSVWGCLFFCRDFLTLL